MSTNGQGSVIGGNVWGTQNIPAGAVVTQGRSREALYTDGGGDLVPKPSPGSSPDPRIVVPGQGDRRVIVAMSGGVDSAVSAGLLVEAGWDVLGVTFRLGADPSTSCCDLGSLDSARASAETLGIPHEVWPVVERFEQAVLRPAWQEYDAGRTPNPCVWCNARLKFPVLLEGARQRSIPFVATGHYARVEWTAQSKRGHVAGPGGEGGAGGEAHDGRVVALCRGRDPRKDQSYFLYGLTGAQLASCRFPLGGLIKAEVRALAGRWGLACQDRPESQDACLVSASGSFGEGLRRRFSGVPRPGEIVDEQGRVLGRHTGVHQFTLGQRKGLGVSTGRRSYVSEIHPGNGLIVLSSRPGALLSAACEVASMHWLPGVVPEDLDHVLVQVRYRSPAVPARCRSFASGRVELVFEQPQRAVTPGQAAVIYDGDRVLGGGPIAQISALE